MSCVKLGDALGGLFIGRRADAERPTLHQRDPPASDPVGTIAAFPRAPCSAGPVSLVTDHSRSFHDIFTLSNGLSPFFSFRESLKNRVRTVDDRIEIGRFAVMPALLLSPGSCKPHAVTGSFGSEKLIDIIFSR
jgi:hypothetical protein